MVYIHSKLMIVDDQIAFISSANVNDRSMLGDRDSELGARVEDNEEIEITMGGNKFMAKKFAHQLRHRLQCNHTGADQSLSKDAIDPVSFYNKWISIANSNRDIYVDVFQKIEDTIKSIHDLHFLPEYGHELKAQNVERLQELRGYVVPYPRNLLIDSYGEPSENDPTAKFYC